MNQLTFSLEEPLANHSRSQDCEEDWMTRVATWHSPILPLLNDMPHAGLSGKTSPVSCLAEEDETLVPSSGRWAKLGYGFAYRVLDAQFFGVAQRRRRVFVVGHLGDWRGAAAVLFERESRRRDTAPSREEGQEAAKTITAGVGQRYDFESENFPIRYKSLGNSMAVPVMKWIGNRIDKVDKL